MLDLSRLSPEQRRVVLAGNGPMLVLAGPGSGKTTVLAARIAYLVAVRRVGPASVLALAFTTGAARELRERLAGVLGEEGRRVDVTTFHSWGLRVIRQWSGCLGFPPGPLSVYGGGDARRLLAEVASSLRVDPDSWPPRELALAVERWRLADRSDEGGSPVARVALAYEEMLRRRSAVDYPAMLVLPLRLLREHPAARGLYEGAYRVVLCDEGQDVCAAQYALLRLLAERHRNLVIVGDPLQAVYAFRGADARYVDAFRRDFPEAPVLSLTQNFRSTGRIVDLANALGAALGRRRPLWTENPPGRPTLVHAAADEAAEATFVAEEVGRLRDAGALRQLGDAAVLCRTKRQVDELALALRRRGLPYRVRGGDDPFGRREVRDAVAYLRLLHNPDDAAALARVVNVPPRRLARLAALAAAHPVPAHALPGVARALGPAAVAAAEGLAELVRDLHARGQGLAPAAALDLALELSGYRGWLASQADGPARLEHLVRLRALAERGGEDLGEWLAELALSDDGPAGDDPDRVQLATIHAAKGCEWPVVFLAGLEEGLLPHVRALVAQRTDGAGLEEERRIAYVGVTRPREVLYLSYCRERRWGERAQPREPSRFLRELPGHLLERAA